MRYYYTKKEEQEIYKSIVILIDTREQKNGHIISWFDAHKIKWKSKKLDFGDYSFYIPKNDALGIKRDIFFNDEIVIERKASLTELAGNLTEDGGRRFESELIRAQKVNAIFDLFIENASDLKLKAGDYRSNYNPKSFKARLEAFKARYGISVNYVSDILMGEHIYTRFYYYARERFNDQLIDMLMRGMESE